MDARVKIFGVRHHGPGSAASLEAALCADDPSLVLIEGPADASDLIAFAAAPGMKPPLALLAYAAEEPGRSVFYPLAEFSPEWRAMRWALARARPVRFIDLPCAISLAKEEAPQEETQQEETQEDAPETRAPLVRGDPLDLLAELAGYEDGEEWWNALVESQGAGPEAFPAIAEAMTALRANREEQAPPTADALREARREAHMRLAIREALAETPGTIAVVVGAWHVPALAATHPLGEDRALLRGLAKTKVETLWIPWTNTRLAAGSGYRAGVVSPGWYAHLWLLHNAPGRLTPQAFAGGWQAKVAALLREKGYFVATASVIEAARLAIGLAALRGRPAPGLAELRDASLAALCHGETAPFRVIETELLIGGDVGEIDEGVPQTPLAEDLARWQKKLRLKPQALEQEIALDLRSEAGLAKSTLLHRLLLLDAPWGQLKEAEAGRGTFREIWALAWTPELSVKLAEAIVHGVTIEQAAAGVALSRGETQTDVAALSELVRACLLADLEEAARRLIARLQAAAVETADLAALMASVPPLVSILRYGTARDMPRDALRALVEAIAAEINAGAAHAARHVEPVAATALRRAMAGFDEALALFSDAHLSQNWRAQLAAMAEDAAVAKSVAGFALRRLHDAGETPPEKTAAIFARNLTPPAAPNEAADFLEGFLGGSAEILLHDPPLLALIDQWIESLDAEGFVEMLPMLRRGFGSFDAQGRRRVLEAIAGPMQIAAPAPAQSGDTSPGFARALPLLLDILGVDDDAA